jgi:hypothetical protein
VLRLSLDHDSSDSRVVAALRGAGMDVLTALEAGNRDRSDPEQLAFASDEGRVLYSANVRDFTRINGDWARQGLVHAGIALRSSQGMPVGQQVHALRRLCSELNDNEIRGRIEYLGAWLD